MHVRVPKQQEEFLTKQEFIQKVASKSGLSTRDAGKAVEAFMDSVTETLKAGDSVNFTGFGKFSASDRAARQGVNPRTGERVQIPATTVPKFSAGSQLKAALKS
ncbi:MAG TPA: HU family DNA-binding protein [Gaiellaceae bacterium]|nr:HU family DNA-binding protein [Gaiellaceae bacterium]